MSPKAWESVWWDCYPQSSTSIHIPQFCLNVLFHFLIIFSTWYTTDPSYYLESGTHQNCFHSSDKAVQDNKCDNSKPRGPSSGWRCSFYRIHQSDSDSGQVRSQRRAVRQIIVFLHLPGKVMPSLLNLKRRGSGRGEMVGGPTFISTAVIVPVTILSRPKIARQVFHQSKTSDTSPHVKF